VSESARDRELCEHETRADRDARGSAWQRVIEVGKKIRIVIEDDGARLAIWIARETAQTTVLAPTRTTLEARSRIGGSVSQQWAMVYVDTVWGAQKLFIKDLGDDPTTPQWDGCSEDAHRR
jgi:hypothetical protein